MFTYFIYQKKKVICALISRILAFVLIFSMALAPSVAYAQTAFNLPAPGTMVLSSPTFNPPIITGIKLYPDNPLKFDFIIDSGDSRLEGEALKEESQKLINYFMATLTVPEDEMWVNLSPYEKDRIIADGLSYTEMGRDMLVQDYILKQLTASLMYPEEEIGSEFWQRIHAKAKKELGDIEIPANTFNKVWIVPDRATIYVHDTNVFVNESHLKVYLEEDYLALESNQNSTKHGLGIVTKDNIEVIGQQAKEIIKEIILPEIEREVNEGKNFANLRQIYNSMILATWYKKNLKESTLGQIYLNQNKVEGIDLQDKQVKEKIYNRYVEAFKKGVYNYIKEDYDSDTQQVIPRKYFAGGLQTVASSAIAISNGPSPALIERFSDGNPEYVVEMAASLIEASLPKVASSPVSQNDFAVSTPVQQMVDGKTRVFNFTVEDGNNEDARKDWLQWAKTDHVSFVDRVKWKWNMLMLWIFARDGITAEIPRFLIFEFRPRVTVVRGDLELAQKEIGILAARQIKRVMEQKDGKAVIGLPTDRTSVPMYKEIVRLGFSWFRATTFHMDEYLGLPVGHPERFKTEIESRFYSQVNLPEGQGHFLDSDAEDSKEEGRRFEREIRKAGGIDIQVHGIGEGTAHMAFVDGGKKILYRSGAQTLSEETRQQNAFAFEGDPELAPTEALTMGAATILEVRELIQLAGTAKKAEPIWDAFEGPISKLRTSSLLRLRPNVHVIVTEPANVMTQYGDRTGGGVAASSPIAEASVPIVISEEHGLVVDPTPERVVLTEGETVDFFAGENVAVMGPHSDDIPLSLGHAVSVMAKYANKVSAVTAVTSPGGVTDDYAREHGGTDEANKKRIRIEEDRKALAALGITDFVNLDLEQQRRKVMPVTSDHQDGRHRIRYSAAKAYATLTHQDWENILAYMEARPDITMWFLPYPFAITPHHPTHENTSKGFLRALKARDFKGKIVFYESYELPPTDFNSELSDGGREVHPNVILPFKQDDMEAKVASILSYVSQIHRDQKYGKDYRVRDAEHAQAEDVAGSGYAYAERFILGRLDGSQTEVSKTPTSIIEIGADEEREYRRLVAEGTEIVVGRIPEGGGLVLIDGITAGGKSTYTDFLRGELERLGRRTQLLSLDRFLRLQAERDEIVERIIREGVEVDNYRNLIFRLAEIEEYVSGILEFLSEKGDPADVKEFEIRQAVIKGRAEYVSETIKIQRGSLLVIDSELASSVEAIRRSSVPKVSFRVKMDEEIARKRYGRRGSVIYNRGTSFIEKREKFYRLAIIPSWRTAAEQTDEFVDVVVDKVGLPDTWRLQIRESTSASSASSSPIDRNSERTSSAIPGGIDFNPNNINLNEQGDKIQIKFSTSNINSLNPALINGISPVIINILPLPSALPLIGLAPRRDGDEFELSRYSLN